MKKKKEGRHSCLCEKNGFPILATVLLVLSGLWILNDLDVIITRIPWFPVILLVFSVGWIIDHYTKK